VLEGIAHILGLGGKKQVAAKRRHIAIGAGATAKSRATDIELVVLDGIENPQTGVR